MHYYFIKDFLLIPRLLVNLLFLSVTGASAETNTNLENGLRLSSTDGQHNFYLGDYLLVDAILQDDNANNAQRFDFFNTWLHIVGTSNYIYPITRLLVSERLRFGTGLYIYYGSSFIRVSYLTNKYDLGSSLNANVSAWSVLSSHFLTGEQEQYKSGYIPKLKPTKITAQERVAEFGK